MINADWVQMNCRARDLSVYACRLEYDQNKKVKRYGLTGLDNFEPYELTRLKTNQPQWHKDYIIKKQPIRTALAQSVYFVYIGASRVAEVLTDVDSAVIDAATVFVRFDNQFLYGENLHGRVCKFLEDNGLIFHNWTRFDVACDFNNFLDGRGQKNLSPQKFIKRFVNEEIKLLNVRKNKKKGGLWFEMGGESLNFQTFYLGSPCSSVRTKLYNKTQEMAAKEDKPYIREQWQLNPEINPGIDVWRLEFSIKDFKAIGVKDGEFMFNLKTLDLLRDENLAQIWNVLQEHYFQFYKEDGTKNVTRKEKLKLFNVEQSGIKLKNTSDKKLTTRADKIFIKKLLHTQQTIREHHAELKQVNFATDYIAAHLVYKHDLAEWARTRFPDWKHENYLEPPAIDFPVVQFTMFEDGFKGELYKPTFGLQFGAK